MTAWRIFNLLMATIGTVVVFGLVFGSLAIWILGDEEAERED